MKISQKMNKLLNQQVTHELGTSHAYLAMSFWFDDQGLKVFGKRFSKQAEEEREHAMKITKYIQDTGGKIDLAALPKPRGEFDSARAAVKTALGSERTVTQQINKLVAAADSEKDYATRSFLTWFVDEQVEEEASMIDLLQMVDLAGKNNLFQVETRLAQSM